MKNQNQPSHQSIEQELQALFTRPSNFTQPLAQDQNERRDDSLYSRMEINGVGYWETLPVTMLGYWENTTSVSSPYVLLRVGVADGVGAWNTKERGRPGLWARLLMHYWALECEERMKLWKVDRTTTGVMGLYNGEQEVDIISMLQRAYLRTKVEMENTGGWVGSTTACVGLLQRSTLHIANVSLF
jgi:hypothetical protein